MGLFSNKEIDWYELFLTSSTFSSRAAKTLKKAFEDGVVDYDEMRKIKDIEHEADKHVHHCMKLVEDAFVTPIDRSEILEIIKEIENITDCIDSTSNHTYIMCVKEVDEVSSKFIDLVVNSCEKLEELMKVFKNYKKNIKQVNDLIIEINQIEEDGDKLYINSMRSLFEFETDAKKIIVLKVLYDKLEDTLDKCEDVADIIHKIIVSST